MCSMDQNRKTQELQPSVLLFYELCMEDVKPAGTKSAARMLIPLCPEVIISRL